MGKIQCSIIGYMGKFGNQMFQYAFGRSYAEEMGCNFYFPDNWIGRKIFNGLESRNSIAGQLTSLRQVNEDTFNHGEKDINLVGFFQDSKFYKYISIDKCKQWFSIKPEWLQMFPKKKEYYIACHLRRGDMEKIHWCYPIIEEECYVNEVEKFGYKKEDIIFVSESNPQYNSKCDSMGIGFLPDFVSIYYSDILFRANSTFSFWSGIIGNSKMYSPLCDFPNYKMVGKVSVPFVEGLGIDKEGVFRK